MISITLTRGFTAVVDDEDTDLAQLKWHSVKSTKDLYYAGRNFNKPNGKRGIMFLHNVVIERLIGRPLEKGEYPDHINLNSMDNTRSNLRVVSNSLNQHNRHRQSNNTSGYKGVSFHKRLQKWTARIAMDNKTINIGVYTTPEEAYSAYCEMAIQLLGNNARLI